MEESTYELITGLCSGLVEDAICDPSIRKTIIKKLRSQAYEIVLNTRHIPVEDALENNPAILLANVLWHVYCKSKAKGQWTKDIMEDVSHIIDRAEILAESNSTFISVVKFLLYLVDDASTSRNLHYQDPNFGLGMQISITDCSFKHKPIIKSLPTINTDIFEVPTAVSTENVQRLQLLNEKPGTGLKHQLFFIPLIPSTSVQSRKFEEDVNNGNWIHSKLNNMLIPVSNTVSDPRSSLHPDEGYVTPDQDLMHDQDVCYIPWEDMYDDEFNSIYKWEDFGNTTVSKEPQFILQRRDSVDPICRVIHASDTTSSNCAKSDLTTLRTVSVEELEVAFKNLLVGVESTIFQYDKDRNSFVLQKGLCLKGSTSSTLEEYCEDFIECGNHFRQLSNVTRSSRKYGLVFQMLCNSMRKYLQCYRGVVLKIPAMQSLLGTHNWLYKLSTQMQFLISLSSFNSAGKSKDLLIYLCDRMPVLHRHDFSYLYYYILQSCFTIYFTFLSKWVFEGVTDRMWEEEFFIKCNPLSEDMYNRKFWTEGFVLDEELVPNCLRGLERELLLCGKSMALLKLCANEDPFCKQVKKEHPEIICCFNKTVLDRVEAKFESYKANCKAHCQLFEKAIPEPHNEEYYAGIMAKTLNEIKDRQEEERRLKAEKKQFQFSVLKKDMEDAKARKVEEKIILLKEEEKLIQEAEKVDQLNDLRRQEEREKIMQFYSTLSEAADRRRDRAEWKIKRAELHDKRCAFLNKEEELLRENTEHKEEQFQQDEESKLLFADKSLEKYLKTYSLIPGSGDFVYPTAESEESQEASKSSVQQAKEEPPKQLLLGEVGDVNIDLYCSEDSVAANENKREWLIALDVADQARQSALKFKQRNMHNDYNIITGEETSYESKFGEKHSQETKEESVTSGLIHPSFKDNSSNDDKNIIGDLGPDINEFTSDSAHNESNEDQVKSIDDQSSSSKRLSPENTPKKLEVSIIKPEIFISSPNKFILNTSFTSTHSESDSNIQEIDMASIHQNVQNSVMIPLLTQLELTSDAILRLFNKHNLLKHMECIWKYFFLLEGEFARNLTKNLFEEVQKAQHPSYLLNVMKLNSLLRCAVGTNVDEEYTERLSFYVKEIPSVFRMLDPGMLDCLSLRYTTHWPINIIITDELIAKQDVIFKHLLKLHRMSWALEETIYLLKDKKLFSSEEYRKVQLFRHVMAHFITTVRQYITAVVIEKTWHEFKKKFQNVTTVDTMYELYRHYIRNVNSKCLLGKARAHTENFFNNLFKEVLIFYEALRSGEWSEETGTGYYRHSNFSRLNHAFDNFKKTADHLMYLFQKMSNTFPNIVQLATALSLNDFYIVKDREHSM